MTANLSQGAPSPSAARPWRDAGLAATAAALAWCLAGRHPLWPTAMPAAWALLVMWMAWQPGAWLWLLPAALPLANFSPWTGWLVFDEFDGMVLAVFCALHARRWWAARGTARQPGPQQPPLTPGQVSLAAALWLLAVLGCAVGTAHAGGWHFNWFAAHEDALWSLRASKGLGWALLLWPWMRFELARAPRQAMHRLGRGMLLGLALVCAVGVQERLAYPGLYDFASHYRTTAMFWEMHVGGAAIDTYLALATPFAAWALWRAHTERHVWRWLLSGLMAVLVTYACLTTFARGVYLAAGMSMLVMALATYAQLAAQGRTSRRLRWLVEGIAALVAIGAASSLLVLSLHAAGGTGMLLCALGLLAVLAWLRWLAQHQGWRLPAALVLATVVLLEVVVVLGGDSFMAKRIDDGPADLDNRVTHWRHGLGLLDGPVDWLLGRGAGRFPADYAASSPQRDFSGRLSWSNQASGLPDNGVGTRPRAGAAQPAQATGIARLEGPRQRADLGGLYAATQRVALMPDSRHSVHLTARAAAPARLLVRVCERHLLYDGNCQAAAVQLRPSGGAWQSAAVALRGPALGAGAWWAPRRAVFSVSVMQGSGAVEIDRVQLLNSQGVDLLENGDFSRQLARWFPSAQRYYLPWHTDNLLLELLIERGVFGAAVFATLLCAALRSLLRALPTPPGDGGSLVPALMASLAGLLCVGLVSSVLDVPRLCFLASFLALFSVSLQAAGRHNPAVQARGAAL